LGKKKGPASWIGIGGGSNHKARIGKTCVPHQTSWKGEPKIGEKGGVGGENNKVRGSLI